MKYKLEKPINGKIGKEKYKITIEWRNGVLIADEPVSSGGMDLGPDPCTLATLRMYIDRKEWDIPEITVNANLFQTIKDEVLTTTIDRDIRFSTATTEEQRTKLLEIAGNCPVSKLLKGEVAVRTYVYNDDLEGSKQIKYTNSEVTVVWKPEVCKHSGRCIFGLPSVFNLHGHPWINMEGASSEEIIQQVNQCPTGALSYYNNKE